jgi:hypothetical protein
MLLAIATIEPAFSQEQFSQEQFSQEQFSQEQFSQEQSTELARTEKQSAPSSEPGRRTSEVQVIQQDKLPDPPADIEELIRRGRVRLITGGGPITDPKTLPSGGRLAGETRFTFRYQYDSRANWQIKSGGSGNTSRSAMVEIRVQFRFIKLSLTHDVWLRDPPDAETFWDESVVRHEFDHVKLSSDPRIEKYFRDSAKKIERMRVPLSRVRDIAGQVDNSKVQALIESRMKQTLQNTTDYVRIRYNELDRMTRHGLLPLPKDAGLLEIP